MCPSRLESSLHPSLESCLHRSAFACTATLATPTDAAWTGTDRGDDATCGIFGPSIIGDPTLVAKHALASTHGHASRKACSCLYTGLALEQ